MLFRRLAAPAFSTIRTMATTATSTKPKLEWLVIVPDKTEAGTLQKRIAIRPQHLANIKPAQAAGLAPMGGAYLKEHPKEGSTDPPQMLGSAMVLVAASEAEVRERLAADVYAAEGVWDVEKAQIWPFRTALRSALE